MSDRPKPSAERKVELAELVARYDAHADYYTSPSRDYNEHSCRDDFINEFLRIFGWDVGNSKGVAPQYREVIAENYSSESERPDYTMTVSGQPCFFIEAKKPSVNIIHGYEPALQARKYGWNAGHSISVLTNFEDLVIYDACVMPKVGDGPSTARYRRFNHCEYVDCFDEIYALISRESVYSGYFYELTAKEFPHTGSGKERVDDVFLGQINEWRLMVAQSLLAADNQFRDEELLNDAIQDFLNQIVFLRICEDKNLPVYHKLYELNESDVEASLMALLHAADKRYNSGLFSQTSAIRYIDDEVIADIVKALYYPQSPYLFDIIESNIFGQIYEMFLSEHVVIDENVMPHLARKSEYRDRSVVATPVEIARYIVKRTLQPLCEGKRLEEILQIRCADIACGSGIFLIEAFQFLMNQCLDWIYRNDRENLIVIEGGRYKLPLDLKKQILSSCLYGIDIDAHAVEVAKFALLIKLIEEETAPSVMDVQPILPNLDDNIVVGNSLVTPDEARRANASLAELEQIVPLDWSLINNGEPLDAIIGNPPYVKIQDLRNTDVLSAAEFNAYKGIYKSSYGSFDKYYLFIERALDHLVDGGYACYIVPNKFFKIVSGMKLRSIIAEGGYLVSLDDFGAAQLFNGRTIYSSILFLQKRRQPQFTYSSLSSPKDLWQQNTSIAVTFDSSRLDSNPWRLTTDIHYLKQLKEIERVAVPITTYFDFFNGIQTSSESRWRYWFSISDITEETDKYIVFSREGINWRIERGILRPFFKQRGLNSYDSPSCDKWIIFPYDRNGQLIHIDTMKNVFPGAWAYLLEGKNSLLPRQLGNPNGRDIPGATHDTWYQYGRNQHLSSFNSGEKIIVGVNRQRGNPLYLIDRNNWIIAAGGTAGYCAASIKSGSPYAIEYLHAWLANGNTERIFEMIGSDFESGFISHGTALLESLPFVELDFENPKHKAMHDEVVDLTKRVQMINAELLANPAHKKEVVLKREKDTTTRRIGEIIDSVYALKDFS